VRHVGGEDQAPGGEGLLPPHSRWRSTVGEFSSQPTPTKAVTLAEFYRRGFGMPAHDFLHSVLRELSIRLHHFHPEGLLHLARFVFLCEGFLGVAPQLSLFRRFFVV
jgi:hypothetical protein